MVTSGLLLGPRLCPPGCPFPDLDTTSALLKCLQKPGTAVSSWDLSLLPWSSERSLFPSHLFSMLRSSGRHSPPPPPTQHAEILTPFHPSVSLDSSSRMHPGSSPSSDAEHQVQARCLTCFLLWSSCTATPTPSHLPTAADLAVALHCVRPSVVSLPPSAVQLLFTFSHSGPSLLHDPFTPPSKLQMSANSLGDRAGANSLSQEPGRPRRWRLAGGCVIAQDPGCLWRKPCALMGAAGHQGLSLSSRAKYLLLQRRCWTWKLYF